MSTLAVAICSMIGFLVAYHTYGRWLSRKLFSLTDDINMPSKELCDGVDYVPTRRSIVFGHHFTSIAGTGPIVGPALAVFWGWLPALLWVIFGSILIGGVHDLAALVISIRNRGQSIGEAAGRLISPRAKILFLIVLAMALSVVLAIFGLVIASIFAIYPESVLSVWMAMPVAVVIGWSVYRRGGGLLLPSLVGLGYEDPVQDTNLNIDEQLWPVSWNL
ncbi:MAG: carbon starvation CstA family protein, partial [Planctomycetota bacterium]